MLDTKSVYWTNRNTAQEHSDYIMSKKEQTLEIKGQCFPFILKISQLYIVMFLSFKLCLR